MAAYNVWLVSLRGGMSNSMAVTSRDEAQAISFGIQNGFLPIIQKAKPAFDGINVQWIDCPITQIIQPYELLVYFLPTPMDTVLRKISDVVMASDLGGSTALMKDGQHGSEVFMSVGDTDLVARMAFHEIMHNKLRMDNALHSLPENKGGGGLAQSVISNKDNLSLGNIDIMAAHLWDRHPQWTGGCSTSNDPLRGLL
jgi:hypothetical protein